MSKEEHRIFFSTSFCKRSSEGFLLNFPFSLDLLGKWKCTIRDIYISSQRKDLEQIYILANFCETSVVDGQQLSILRKFYLEENKKYYSFVHPLYIPLKQNYLNKIEIRFLDKSLKDIIFEEDFFMEFSLHFYKHVR